MQAGRLHDKKFHTHDETSKDEKQHDTVDKSTSKQQFCINDDYYKVGFAGAFLGSHTFPYQSLLLSTTVLNDDSREEQINPQSHIIWLLIEMYRYHNLLILSIPVLTVKLSTDADANTKLWSLEKFKIHPKSETLQ